MAKAAWENKLFHDPVKAREWLEKLLWPDGPVCGYCGVAEDNSPIASRPGFYQCNACRKQFTVMVGTVFERSHIPLNKWLMAAALLCASKKGVSAHQIHRMLGITYKSAWFMMHRLREAMAPGGKAAPLGGLGKIVEADETYLGKRRGRPAGTSTFVTGFGWVQPSARYQTERKIVSLVERGGNVRSFKVDGVNKETIFKILFTNVDRKSELMTDEAPAYSAPGARYKAHYTVNHSQEEWVRSYAHTNTIEGYFSIFKRGIKGVYQHVSEQHLHRYLAEFDFRTATVPRAELRMRNAPFAP